MNLLRKPGAIAVAALALAVLPSAAEAHDGDHPFANCTEAYENGYANIPEGDEHYGTHLDRDGDGIGCDSPPADFTPAKDQEADAAAPKDTDLAETGGDDTTPYFAAAGMSVMLAGAGVLVVVNRRRADH
ncbi:excalibur calcium-binding domain-containing protein [Streptomyces sp. S3(2020)]|uniref:excalibur calcium-binding domain-containing protein n=1 Tax=Streptomyces sp. S3(2020) TaxID=2732044 RepID=UPI001489E845|nr:excalibur calcium-binding domain-containing protein [Streptomyces sp. S3(2020)]